MALPLAKSKLVAGIPGFVHVHRRASPLDRRRASVLTSEEPRLSLWRRRWPIRYGPVIRYSFLAERGQSIHSMAQSPNRWPAACRDSPLIGHTVTLLLVTESHTFAGHCSAVSVIWRICAFIDALFTVSRCLGGNFFPAAAMANRNCTSQRIAHEGPSRGDLLRARHTQRTQHHRTEP